MFKPCPNCGFLVALIAGREASQRCPRCGSAMLEDGELPPVDEAPAKPAAPRDGGANGSDVPSSRARATGRGADDDIGMLPSAASARATTHAPGREDPVGLRNAGSIADATAGDTPPSTDTDDGHQHAGTSASSSVAAVSSPADAGPRATTAIDANAVANADMPAASARIDADTPGANAGADENAHATLAPSFSAPRARRPRPRHGRRWPWAVALPLLGLLLALQLLLSQRAELAQDATWRPLVTTACAVLGCEVPAWREPTAFAMLARNVRPHASRDGVLHVTTSLRNDASWPQPLPVVVLSLSDVDGRVLAARAVPPSDYGRTAATLVDPGDSVDIAFDVREPSPGVVSFDFQLR